MVFIGVLLIGGLIIYFSGPDNSGESENNLPSSCKDIENITLRDSCYFNLAVLNKNLSACMLISDNWQKGDCYDFVRGK